MRCKAYHLSSLHTLMPLKLSIIHSHVCSVPRPPALSLMRTHFQHTHTHTHQMHILQIRGPRQYTHTQTHYDYATQSTAFRLHPQLSISPNALVYFCHLFIYLPVANVLADFATLHCFERTPRFRCLFFHSLFMHYSFLDCECAIHQIENSRKEKKKKYLHLLAPHQTRATLFSLFWFYFIVAQFLDSHTTKFQSLL